MPTLKDLRKKISNAYCGERVVYHHLPKCGGTSVIHALRWRYLPSFALFPTDAVYRAIECLHPDWNDDQIMDEVIDFREKKLLSLMFSDVRCVAGHVRVSQVALDRFSDKYNFITTLRDPTSLMISLYFYDKSHPLERWRTDKDIETYLETPRARSFAAIYADFYCGLPPQSDTSAPEAVERAKRNLARFAVVGLVDNMAQFQSRLREVLGVRVRIGHLNKVRAGREALRGTVTAAVRKKIEAMTTVNQEIYEFVRSDLTA